MAHHLRERRYFSNHLQDYDGKLSEKDMQSKYKSDILKEIANIVEVINRNVTPEPRAEDGGLYVGLSGVAFGLFHVSQSEHVPQEIRDVCLATAGTYLHASLEFCSKKSEERRCTGAAFFLGHLGVYAFAAVYFSRCGDAAQSGEYVAKFIALHKMCKPVDFLACGGDELLVGRAGYLCGALYLQQELGASVVPDSVISAIVTSIIESGRKTASNLNSPSPLMYSYYDTLYLGAGHGLSSILQMLLQYSQHLDSEALKDVKAASYCLLSCETLTSNYPAALDETRDNLWHWCHGAPGVIYFLIKANLVLKVRRKREVSTNLHLLICQSSYDTLFVII